MNFRTRKNLSAMLAGLTMGLSALTAMAQTAASFGNLPLYFEANSPTRFLARDSDAQFLILPTATQLVLRNTESIRAVEMQFIGANPQAEISGDTELSGKINYFTGNDPAQWRSDIPIFAKVRITEIYPGINLVYYGNQRQLEYDFTIAPNANPNVINIHFGDVDKVAANAQGELVLNLGGREIHQPKPVIYQKVGGLRQQIDGGYKILDAHTVAFSIGKYDANLPLVIDPILSYSTYFGGTLGEFARAVAINTNDGSIYITGQTFSKLFTNGAPFSTSGAFQTNFAGGTQAGDAFVAKFDKLGTNLSYLTYLGGSADDAAYGIAVDDAGHAFIAGATDSTNFPVANATVNGGYQGNKINGVVDKNVKAFPTDAFVAELETNGSSLIYSTYLGGESSEAAYGIAIDSADDAYVTGFTYSTNFPTTSNALQKHLACTNSFYINANAFVSEITNGGGALVFSTYLGGTNFDEGKGIAVDVDNYIYVTGFTASTNFPTTNFISQVGTNSYNGDRLNGSTNKVNFAFDAFVTKIYPSGNGLVYSTYLGGTNNDVANSIAADGSGGAYVTGWTISTNFPDTIGTNVIVNHLTNNMRGLGIVTTNTFLTKITNEISAGIAYSVVFGGRSSDVGYGVTVDSLGNTFVVGTTSSTNFPVYNTSGLLRATNSGSKSVTSDVFVTSFNTNASALLYSVYLGGKQNDSGYGIALDSLDNAYVVGQTASTNFPTLGAFQSQRNGTNDAFLAEIVLTPLPPEITTQPTNQDVAVGSFVTFNAIATGIAPLIYQWQLDGTNLVNGGNINGTTNNILTISNVQLTNSGNYSVIVTNFAGAVTSSVAVLTVTNPPPTITTQPISQTVGIGSTVSFNVNGPAPAPPYFFQWLKDGTDLTDGTNMSGSIISGSTNFVLTISNTQTNDAGNYWVVVTNAGGSATSSNAVLTVLMSPSFTRITAANDGSSFILSGVGGTNSGLYSVLTSSNLATPLDLWTPVATNHFGGQGQFIFTNIAPTNAPQMFYILQMP